MRHLDRELQTDPSSGTYNLDQQEVDGAEELEKIAVSRKPFREFSSNSNARTNLVSDENREVLRRIVCVKLKDDIHSVGELNNQMMALKQHVKASYRLWNLIRVQKNDRMTSNLSKWIRTGVKEKQDLEEVGYKILSQFKKERRDLLYHTADGVVACRRKAEEKILHKDNLRSYDQMGHQGIKKVQRKNTTQS